MGAHTTSCTQPSGKRRLIAGLEPTLSQLITVPTGFVNAPDSTVSAPSEPPWSCSSVE